ncbi:MAG TPA: polysaccharide biosynthesis/export family protein [Verrucomicrobiae bacterium]|nr:polysaccharide biosynthesis/export family protein [Verrucomicrobiae bacterium]
MAKKQLMLLGVAVLLSVASAGRAADKAAKPGKTEPAAKPAVEDKKESPGDKPVAGGAPEDYKLTASDLIIFDVVGERDFRQELRVNASGIVVFPYVGKVEVAGKTRSELINLLTSKLKPDYFVNPQIFIEVKEYSRRTVTVLGQVNRQGTIAFPAEQKMNVLEAIGLADGFTRAANKRRIHIIRASGKTVEFDLPDWKKKEDRSQLPLLEPGDVVDVDETIL